MQFLKIEPISNNKLCKVISSKNGKFANLITKGKQILTKHYKMKLLTTYIIANLLYILIGSYIFMTGKITTNFHYLEFSRGLKNLLILNMLVFSIICFEKKYKKSFIHIIIFLISVFRCYFNDICL